MTILLFIQIRKCALGGSAKSWRQLLARDNHIHWSKLSARDTQAMTTVHETTVRNS